MWKARFCHSTSLYKIGNEAVLQAPLTTPLLGFGVLSGWPGGQVMLAGSDARNSAVCPAAETPAGWGVDKGTQRTLAPIKSRGQGVGALASGLPGDLFSYVLHLRPAEWPIMAGHTLLGYVLAVGIGEAVRGARLPQAIGALVVWVAFLNGGTLAINSVFDKDEGDIGYLRAPPPPP